MCIFVPRDLGLRIECLGRVPTTHSPPLEFLHSFGESGIERRKGVPIKSFHNKLALGVEVDFERALV